MSGSAGSAIGAFIIGTSPIFGAPAAPPTFVPPTPPARSTLVPPAFPDWRKTVISQYDNRPALSAILAMCADALNPAPDFETFHNYIWNLDTAQGYGLDVWGRIVGVSRTLQVQDEKYLGFNQQSPLLVGTFGESSFYTGQALTSNYALSDTAYRRLIYAKAAANISDGSVASINGILRALFPGRGNCYVTDNLNMTMTYVFEFTLTPVEVAIVNQSGALPRPSGVQQFYARI